MSGTDPQVSIIVVHYNTPELTEQLIHSILEFTRGIVYNIIVVDNDPTSKRSFTNRFDKKIVKVVASEGNLGFGRGVNLAAKQTEAEFL